MKNNRIEDVIEPEQVINFLNEQELNITEATITNNKIKCKIGENKQPSIIEIEDENTITIKPIDQLEE